jgi:hypothetical protein
VGEGARDGMRRREESAHDGASAALGAVDQRLVQRPASGPGERGGAPAPARGYEKKSPPGMGFARGRPVKDEAGATPGAAIAARRCGVSSIA